MTTRTKLTTKAISKMRAPDPSGKQVLHWDTELRGFGLLCSGVSSARTFVAQRDVGGHTRRVTVGSAAEITLDVARARAAEALDGLRRGVDPKARKTTLTLREALDGYLAARTLRAASVRAYTTSVTRYLSAWLDLPLHSVTSEMVEQRHRSIAAEIGGAGGSAGKVSANCAMRVFRALYTYAAERTPGMPPNPVARLRRQWNPEPRRTRVVRAEQLPAFYAAVRALPNPVAADFLTLALFTGMRLGECRSLRWEDVDLRAGVIRLPASATKAKRALDLPMSSYVVDLLVARRALGDAKYVFPGRSGGHLMDAQHPLKLVAEACGVAVSAHDLRRTWVTVAALHAGISQLALKALVNHALGGDVTAGYVMLTTEHLRQPAQAVCDEMLKLCGAAPVGGGNVRKLKA